MSRHYHDAIVKHTAPVTGECMTRGSEAEVSVIICTYNRPQLLRRALRSVLAQISFDLEVIVVDDGSTPPVADADVADPRIQLIRLPHRGVSAARATGLATATAPLIAFCDDDDRWAPDHLPVLMAALATEPAAALVYGDAVDAGTSAPLVRSMPTASDLIPTELSRVHPSAVLARTTALRRAGGFDHALTAYEDLDLWLRLRETQQLGHVPRVITECGDPRSTNILNHHLSWQRLVEREQTRRRADRNFRNDPRRPQSHQPTVPFDPATWQSGRQELTWQSTFNPYHSFGIVSRNLVTELEQLGVTVARPRSRDQLPPDLAHLDRPFRRGRMAIVYDVVRMPSFLRTERVICYSMWESTNVPARLVEDINRSATLLYVPCRQNARSYRDCGVTIPIRLLHHGVDGDAFPLLTRQRRPDSIFTFGTYGCASVRKGIDLLIKAFRDEFALAEPVRLLIKSNTRCPVAPEDDPRIVVRHAFLEHGQMLDLLAEMDAFVLPSRGEGFGLGGLEAMATGLPLIATEWSGPAEYLDPADTYPLHYHLVEAGGAISHPMQFFGEWAEPDYHHLRQLLRTVYTNRAEAAAKGQRAAARVHRDWTWQRVARQLYDDLNLIAAGITPASLPDEP